MIEEEPSMEKRETIVMFAIALFILSLLSEGFTSFVEKVAKELNFTDLFVGVVLVGTAGNVADHMGIIRFAFRNRITLAMNTTIGNSIRIVFL